MTFSFRAFDGGGGVYEGDLRSRRGVVVVVVVAGRRLVVERSRLIAEGGSRWLD